MTNANNSTCIPEDLWDYRGLHFLQTECSEILQATYPIDPSLSRNVITSESAIWSVDETPTFDEVYTSMGLGKF